SGSGNNNSNPSNAGNPWSNRHWTATACTSTPSNYNITYNVAPVGLTINAKALTATGVSGTNKSYDGLNNDPITGTASLSGLVTKIGRASCRERASGRLDAGKLRTSRQVNVGRH